MAQQQSRRRQRLAWYRSSSSPSAQGALHARVLIHCDEQHSQVLADRLALPVQPLPRHLGMPHPGRSATAARAQHEAAAYQTGLLRGWFGTLKSVWHASLGSVCLHARCKWKMHSCLLGRVRFKVQLMYQ